MWRKREEIYIFLLCEPLRSWHLCGEKQDKISYQLILKIIRRAFNEIHQISDHSQHSFSHPGHDRGYLGAITLWGIICCPAR